MALDLICMLSFPPHSIALNKITVSFLKQNVFEGNILVMIAC